MDGALKYTSGTMSAYLAASSHQSRAGPSAVYGLVETRRNGRAPRSARTRRNNNRFLRYCAFVADHGVGRFAPNISFRAMIGFSQPDDRTARSRRRSARSSIVDSGFGAEGVPIRLF